MNAPARRRVCFVLPSLNGGGAERAAVQILNAFDPAAWDRSMYLFERRGPYLADLETGIALESGSGGSRLQRWRQLRRFLAVERPELIVSFLSYFVVLTAARAARIGAKVVFNQQTPVSAFLTDADYVWRHRWQRQVFTTVTRFVYRRADAVITTSAGVADDLVAQFGVDRERIRIVHNPVDAGAVACAAREPLEPEIERRWQRPVIVAAGRLADAKNYPLLLDALGVLRKTVPATLFILGEGEREPALREQVARLELEDAVIFCGFQRNPWKYIARADVFALTSRYEGFGNVLVEAMACGVPVVATASSGTREIVTNGTNGLLIEKHEPVAVADALKRLLTDIGLRRRLAAGAAQSVARFERPAIAAAYDRALRGVFA